MYFIIIKDGSNGTILFRNNNAAAQESSSQYNWSQKIDDLAFVAYELHLLQTVALGTIILLNENRIRF